MATKARIVLWNDIMHSLMKRSSVLSVRSGIVVVYGYLAAQRKCYVSVQVVTGGHATYVFLPT